MKTTIGFIGALAVVAVMSLGSGCATRTDGNRIEKGKMVVNNGILASGLEVIQDAGRRTPEGFLRVQVRLINKDSGDMKLQYRFKWIDADGMTLSQISAPWSPLVLHGTEVHELEGVSGMQGADDFRLEIRQ